MARFIEIKLEARGVSCVARLLDEEAPRTAAAVWDALPHSEQAYHGKYARNEVYTLVPAFAPEEPGFENTTITPIPGDVVYWSFEPWQLKTPSHGYRADVGRAGPERIIDLAYFYERNNLLLNPDTGWVPGNVFATITEGLAEFAQCCERVHREGMKWFTVRRYQELPS